MGCGWVWVWVVAEGLALEGVGGWGRITVPAASSCILRGRRLNALPMPLARLRARLPAPAPAGVASARVNSLFYNARKKAPSIIFIDEVRAVRSKSERQRGKAGSGFLPYMYPGLGGVQGVRVCPPAPPPWYLATQHTHTHLTPCAARRPPRPRRTPRICAMRPPPPQVDAIGRARSTLGGDPGSMERESALLAMLVQMDGIQDKTEQVRRYERSTTAGQCRSGIRQGHKVPFDSPSPAMRARVAPEPSTPAPAPPLNWHWPSVAPRTHPSRATRLGALPPPAPARGGSPPPPGRGLPSFSPTTPPSPGQEALAVAVARTPLEPFDPRIPKPP